MATLFYSLWNVMSIEEAVAEVRSLPSPVLAAKRLQDLAQGYGCHENLSIMVLRFHNFNLNQDLIRELKFNTMSNKVKVNHILMTIQNFCSSLNISYQCPFIWFIYVLVLIHFRKTTRFARAIKIKEFARRP